jgi:homopolymeric O-antigen transport system ATP-binding protein
MTDDVLIRADGVSKKFCRSLKKSLWYGVRDMVDDLAGRSGSGTLRKDEFWAVDDVSFEVRRGECLGLIGRNGAGKTTLLKMLNGLIKPDKGRIEVRGRLGALIALGAGFNPILTGRENIYVNASVLGLSKKEIDAKIDEIVDFAEIGEFIDSPVQSYSSGMQVRLGFAIATAIDPDVLLLDEVLAVGDAAFRVKCFNRIHQILQNCAVIVVSHAMEQVTRICSSMLLLEHGRLVDHGTDFQAILAAYNSVGAETTPSEQGSGKARISSVLFEDADEKPCTSLQHGAPFSVSMQVTMSDAAMMEKSRLLVTIARDDGTNVAQVLEDLPSFRTQSQMGLRLKFRDIPFSAGRYWLTCSVLLGRYGELAHVVRNAVSFAVENDYATYAPTMLHPALECQALEVDVRDAPPSPRVRVTSA